MLTSVLRGMAGATRALVPLSAPTPAHGDEKTAKKQQGQEGSRNNEGESHRHEGAQPAAGANSDVSGVIYGVAHGTF